MKLKHRFKKGDKVLVNRMMYPNIDFPTRIATYMGEYRVRFRGYWNGRRTPQFHGDEMHRVKIQNRVYGNDRIQTWEFPDGALTKLEEVR